MSIFKRPSIRALKDRRKADMPEGLWQKCPNCEAVIHELELKQNLRVCASCGHHFLMGWAERVEHLLDANSWEELDANLVSVDPLGFARYPEKIAKLRQDTGLNDAVVCGRGRIDGQPLVLCIMDFSFFAGSMGSVVGEKITRAIEAATAAQCPVIVITASSGARMQEGMLSLMQMAKTSVALARHHEAGCAYIAVMTHPTTGGVTASFATLGDINLAEPGCMIGFAGPRVVKETTHQNLPKGFQTAEFMLQHGLLDRIVPRQQLRQELGNLIGYLQCRA